MSGSASDITQGVLPVAQVPPLDAGQITTGTMSLARLPASSSNIFTGYDQAAVSGTGVMPFGQGGFLAANRDGAGKTCFANNRGGTAAGGWEWVSYSGGGSSGAFEQVAATLGSTGGLTLASVAAGGTVLGTDGSVSAGGVITVSQGSAAGASQILLNQNAAPACTHRIASRHYPTALAGNAIDMYLWTWGVDGAGPGSRLGLSVTQTGIGINNTPNPAFGVDCNGSANVAGVIRGLGVGGLLVRVFDESATALPASGPLPDLFRGRPVDAQVVSAVNFPQSSAGVAIAAGYTQNYSVRVSGYLRAPSADTYTFSVFADDGVRVWVNGTKVLDAWQVQSATLTTNAAALSTAWVPFRVEYCQGSYGSGLTIAWRGASNNTSYQTLAHSASGTGFQMAYDNVERAPTSMGTTWFDARAYFVENAGFGGQTAPQYPVDVTGSVRSSGDAYAGALAAGGLGNTGCAAVGYAGLGAAGYAVLQTAAGATRVGSVAGQGVTFRDGDVAGMTYRSGALRVGDGAAPMATVDVAGTVQVAAGQPGLVVGTANGALSSLVVQANGGRLEMGVAYAGGDLSAAAAAGDAVVRARPSGSGAQGRLMLQSGSAAPSVTVGPTGLVGVGSTVSPTVALDVGGGAHVTGSLQADGVLYMNNQTSPCMLALSSTTAGIPAASSTGFYGLGMLPGTGMRYQVAANATDSHVFMGGTTEIMRVTSSGAGTTVAGAFNVRGLSTLATVLVGTALRAAGTNTSVAAGATGDCLAITGGGGSKGLAVDYNSRVGIGTLAPGFPLDVVGAARIQSSGAPAALYSYANGQVSSYWSAGSDANNNYAVANQQNVGVYLANGQTSWSSNSDARLKTDVQTIPSGLDVVDRIRPVSFHWKRPGHALGFGVIAQELEQVLPELVDEHLLEDGEDGDGAALRLGVRYQDLIPFLIRAVQELRAEVRCLRTGAPGSIPAPRYEDRV
ncbi:hypothetical protein WJX74_002382 [Apatococcus lobatus]|uniref:Peptidase S74 domain-containing protein n=1 Tax=Apatococcus lobatus TaxID=904363 RepID=A0AAW1Q5G3_9CHLO